MFSPNFGDEEASPDQDQNSYDKYGIQSDIEVIKNQGPMIQAPRAGSKAKRLLFLDDAGDSEEKNMDSS